MFVLSMLSILTNISIRYPVTEYDKKTNFFFWDNPKKKFGIVSIPETEYEWERIEFNYFIIIK